jgi:hypothetical protein
MALRPWNLGEVAVVLFVLFVVVAALGIGEAAWVPLSQGALMLLVLGLAFLSMAVYTVRAPRADGLRAVRMIDGAEVGPAEAFGARAAASIVALLGVGMVALSVWRTAARPYVGLLLAFVALDLIYDPGSIGPPSRAVVDFGNLGPGERVVLRLAAVAILLVGVSLVWASL